MSTTLSAPLALAAPAVGVVLAAARRAWAHAPTVALVGAVVALGEVVAVALGALPPWGDGLTLLHASTVLGKLAAVGCDEDVRVRRGDRAPAATPRRGGSLAVRGARAVLWVLIYPGLSPRRAFEPDPRADRRRGVVRTALGLAEVASAFVVAAVAARLGWLDGPAHVAAAARAASFLAFLDGVFRASSGVVAACGLVAERFSRAPWASADLSDLWARRWNLFVARTLAEDVYAPVRRRAGRRAAGLATFLVSGVFHEVLFGLPAGGVVSGRWLAFFLAHGAAVAVEGAFPARTAAGRALRRGLGWAFFAATAPLFFGGPYPVVVPFEALRAAF